MEPPATSDRENSYRGILRRISSFGGVQVFNILVNLARGKFVAILLGPEGMGISSLFNSSTLTITQASGLGLNLAMVKEVAANKSEPEKVGKVLKVCARLILFTSLLGALLCLILSPWLSRWTFGSYEYTISFAILSLWVGLSVAGAGYLSLLQGLGEVKRLAKASLVGGLTGLFCGVPLYWWMGLRGIVPAMVILGFATFLFYYLSFRKSAGRDKETFRWKEMTPLVKRLFATGFMLMLGTLAGTAVSYLINTFVRSFGSVADVGLFQAANSLTNQYTGIIFSALALDYFPRLSEAARERSRMCAVVNRQTEIVTLAITPIILLLLLTSPLVIRLLLADDFLVITPLMRWLGFGVLLQAVSFPLGYIFLAHDNRRAYIWIEVVVFNILWFTLSIVGYYYLGLIGLGVSLVVRSGIDIVVYYAVCRRVYGFRYSRRTLATLAGTLATGTAGFILSLLPSTLPLILLILLFAASLAASLLILRRRLRQESKA